MNVYVESNFVLEQAFEQEQCESCEQLIELASNGVIRLIVPAFSLAEAHMATMRKTNERNKMIAELQRHLSEIGRSKHHREAPENIGDLTGVLLKSAERERAALERTVDRMLDAAYIIPLDAEIFGLAGTIQAGFDMSAQDSIMLASIVFHLRETKPLESCHLNRNTKDFDDPNVRDMLDGYGCKFFARFDEGVRYVESRPRPS